MGIRKWLERRGGDLRGKWIAVTGTTGGLGVELCGYLAELGANLILLDRNRKKSETARRSLQDRFPEISVECMTVDLEDACSVKAVTEQLLERSIDLFIHNAGAYSIPRHTCSTDYDNVFQINFVSPYYMIRRLLPSLRARGGRVVIVGSIAHNYSKIDPNDVDFSTRKAASKVYGNAKRYLMYGVSELMKEETDVSLSIVHPGITFTNITAHYPKVIFAIIKHPMKVIFMKPKKAALCLLVGVLEIGGTDAWFGPRLFDVWGYPSKKRLRTANQAERERIAARAEEAYARMEAVEENTVASCYWEEQVKEITSEGIFFTDGQAVSFSACAKTFSKKYDLTDCVCVGERDITRLSFFFDTSSRCVTVRFRKRSRLVEAFKRENAEKRFHDLQKRILELGYRTYDLS